MFSVPTNNLIDFSISTTYCCLLIVLVHYSYGMALGFPVTEKERLQQRIFGKISSCKCLKDRRSELEDMTEDIN